MISIEQLRAPPTSEEVLTDELETLKSLGFQTTGWQVGRVQRTFLKAICTIIADATEIAKTTIEFAFNRLSKGAALSELSKSRFDNTRNRAVKTKGPMTLSSTASIPYTIEPGKLLVATENNIVFRNVTGGTLSAGNVTPSSLDLTFEAVVAGSAANIEDGLTLTLLTPLAGVTCTNPGDPWYTTIGVDEEADATLHRRNETRWPTLSIELVREGYENLALNVNGITKTYVDDQNPRGPFTVDVYVAGDLKEAGDTAKEALQAEYAKRVLGTASELPADPATSDSSVVVRDAPSRNWTLAGTVYYSSTLTLSEIQPRVELAVKDFLTPLPLGGSDYSPGPANVLAIGDIYEVLEGVDGVKTVDLTDPTDDLSVGTTAQVLVPTFNLAYVAVTS